jgi:alkylation response protein AidB-like acyl-CoA dehydrogenase
MFIVDLRSDGVTIRPLRQMTGGAEFNEVFLDDVIVPADAVIGEMDCGWAVVKTWITYEHGGVAHGNSAREDGYPTASPFVTGDDGLIEMFRKFGGGQLVRRDAVVRSYIEAVVHQMLVERLSSAMRSGAIPVQAGSLLKVGNAVKLQRREELRMHLAGAASLAWEDPADGWFAHTFLSSRGRTIGAGTNEIHWNGVGEHVLGLPREPSADRGVPFRQVVRAAEAVTLLHRA